MINNYRFILISVLCILFSIQANATHNRAGEITYKWIGPGLYTYEIKVTTYTFIGGPNLADRCEDTVYFGDGTGATVLRSNGPIGSCPLPALMGVPLNSKIKLNEYVTTHTYPGPGNYKISVEDPNRNGGIINMPNSVNMLFYIESYLVIPSFGNSKNSSPILTFPPIDNGCMTQCFYHNPGAYDIDGDSLSYELTPCKGASGLPITGYTYPASGGGGIFSLDSLTGTLTWCNPQLQGEYTFAILIKEWRLDSDGDYFMVGYVERDMQVDIGSCNNVPPQIIFNNLDTCILAGTTLTNTLNATDANPDFITLWANGGSFAFTSNPSTFLTTPGSSTTSGIFNWNTDSTHVRRLPYQVTVKVQDDDPLVSLVHFKTFNIKVIPYAPRNLSTMPSGNSILLKWNKPSAYSLSGSNPFSHYKIYRKSGLSNWIHTGHETAPPAYTGFTFIGYTTNSVNDTVFYDNNGGIPFTSGQDYSYVVLAEYTDGASSYVSNMSSNQATVGLEELSLNNRIQIFPNPTHENVYLTFNQNSGEVLTLELTDVMGRQIKTFTHNEAISKQNTINLSLENIHDGIYFLKITGNNTTSITKKIIKQ
jgi:hypothetical protein